MSDLRYVFLSICEPCHEKSCLMPYANIKSADQPTHLCSLIIHIVAISKIPRRLLASVAEKAGFSLRSGYSPGGRASKNYLPGRRVNNLLLARQRK